jgi:chemotaxis signal transduction protein/HPt (histidine-containing phosphotransfer) domain-containing protein
VVKVEEFNSSEYQEIKNDFIDEAMEHLQTLEDGLLIIEQDSGDYELLNTVFRAVHSIKGAADYLELDKIVATAHVMENILDDLRNGTAKANKQVVNYLLKGVDLLQGLVHEVKTGEDKNIDYQSFVNEAPSIDNAGKDSETKNNLSTIRLNTDNPDRYEGDDELEQSNKYIIFKLADQCYGVNVPEIKEIVKISEITPIPYLDEDITGLMNLRGEIITIVDMRKKLTANGTNDSKNRIIILNREDTQVGFIVDQVMEVMELLPEDIKPPMVDRDFNADYVYGVAETQKAFIMLLDIRKILNI